MHHFFTTESTAPPAISALWYSVMVLLIVTAIMMSLRYYQNEQFRKCFQYLQGFQLICLYLWYFAYHIPWSNSLPFYHCRMAMFVVLLLPGKSMYKQYFSLLGIFGTLAAFVYPVPDAYPFPHIAILSFIFGHLALLGNSLVYLFRQYDSRLLDVKRIVLLTFSLNALIFVVNLVTGGDYGFLTKPPLVGDHGLVANYLIVSLVLATAISLTKKVLEAFLEQKAEKILVKKA